MPSTANEKYLELGRVLSEKSGDPHILGTMLCAVKTRGNIVTDRVENKYLEVLKNMGIDTAELADFLTDGKYSEYRDKSETLAAEITVKDAENKAKDAENTALAAKKTALAAKKTALVAKKTALVAEITAKDAEIKALVAGQQAFETIAVLAIYSSNKSAEEISAKLKLSLSDVRRILEDTIKKI
ncbi:MAG: hypothetical protein LBR80_15140 [Deltaproteobacteria bacterium]|nr:hypothetical protein [Deltaproteobacteria bacterium]